MHLQEKLLRYDQLNGVKRIQNNSFTDVTFFNNTQCTVKETGFVL